MSRCPGHGLSPDPAEECAWQSAHKSCDSLLFLNWKAGLGVVKDGVGATKSSLHLLGLGEMLAVLLLLLYFLNWVFI